MITLECRRKHVRHRLPAEQRLAGEHLEQHDSTCPAIGTAVQCLATRLIQVCGMLCQSRSAKVEREYPEMMATYCLPSTS